MSTKLDRLIEFYSKLLVDVGVFDKDGKGLLCYDQGGAPHPVSLNGTRLCLPTREIVRDGDWTARTAFHPLSEQINQGPSPVLNAFKAYILERIKPVYKLIAVELAELVADHSRHKGLSTKAAKFMKPLVGFDDTTTKALEKVLKRTNSDIPEKRLVSIFLKNGGNTGVLRSCSVSFPVMDDAESEDTTTFFEVVMPRKTKDKGLIVALLNYVLGEAGMFDGEVKSGDAPYFESLLISFRKVAEHLNGLIDLHGVACPVLKDFRFQLEWVDVLDDFTEFCDKYGVAVPALPGNMGLEPDAEDEEEEVATKSSVFEATADKVGAVDLPFSRTGEDRSGLGGSVHRSSNALASNRDEDNRGMDTRRSDSGNMSISDILRGDSNNSRDSGLSERRPTRDTRDLFSREPEERGGIRLGGGGGLGLGGRSGKRW